MSPIGSDPAITHTIIIAVPDISYYINDNGNLIPWGTSMIDLDIYPVPDLVIEVANNSLADQLGEQSG